MALKEGREREGKGMGNMSTVSRRLARLDIATRKEENGQGTESTLSMN